MAWGHAASLDQVNGRCRLGVLFESSPGGEAGNLLTEGCFEVHPSCSASWFHVSPQVKIRALVSSDAGAYQALRLFALQESPTAFGSSHGEECDRTIEQVVGLLCGSQERTFFGCFDAGNLIGVVGVGREQGSKERHIAFIRSMFVAPGYRGKGAGKQLLLAALDQVAQWASVEQVTLAVTATNEPALSLYKSCGFIEVGRMPRALRVKSQYYDEINMLRWLSAG